MLKKLKKNILEKLLSHLNYDVNIITNLVTILFYYFLKIHLTLNRFIIGVMFYQNWKLVLFALIMIPLASIAAKSLGKRMGKVTTEAQEVGRFFKFYLLKYLKIIK